MLLIPNRLSRHGQHCIWMLVYIEICLLIDWATFGTHLNMLIHMHKRPVNKN